MEPPVRRADTLTSAREPPSRQPRIEAIRRKIAYSSDGTSGEPLRTSALDLIRKSDPRGDVADFGAGKGNLIRSLLEMDCFSSITGFDLMERPSDLPANVQWCNTDLNQPVDRPADSFDLIASLGLIEYLENPYAFVRELHRVLRPRGIAILTTPNNESWRALLSLVMRGHFVAFPLMGSNINLTALIRTDFERILHFGGFQDVSFSYSRSGMIPKLTVSWQALSGGMLLGRRYSDDLVVACRKAP
jgi:2-polyprenyl-3-methyl-5-hydroxy-6-metoxy-1,4-benzoquinol methylase